MTNIYKITAGKSFFTFSSVLYSVMRNSNVGGQPLLRQSRLVNKTKWGNSARGTATQFRTYILNLIFCSCLDMLNCILEYFKVITKLLIQSKSNY